MISRRTVLGGLGFGAGAALFLPFFKQALADDSGPCRFVFVVEGNCIEPTTLYSSAARAAVQAQASGSIDGQRWFYRQYGHSAPIEVTDGDLGTAPALDHLEGDDTRASLVADSLVLHGLSSKVAGGGHTTHHGALSCTRSRPGLPGGITIDAWLAALAQVQGDAPFDAVRLGVDASTGTLAHSTCAYGQGRTAPVILDPSMAFTNLFGSVASAAGRRAFRERGELLDFAMGDVKRAQATFSGGSVERAKLDTYLASLETVSRRQQRLVDMEDTLNGVKPPGPDESPLYGSTRPLDRLQAQFDLVTAALLGGLTNVAVLTSGTGYAFDLRYSSIIGGVGRHDLHHESGGNATYRNAIHEVTRAHVGMVAELARTLQATPEIGGDGSMLDNTVIVYLSDNGEQHHSTSSEWPMLLLGGKALGLRTGGRTVVYPGVADQRNNRQVSNLFNTLGHLAGEDLNDFGGEGASRITEGPLGELG